jgi:hypothetical protein
MENIEIAFAAVSSSVGIILWAALIAAHLCLSAWVNLARGGAHGVLKPPGWFPGRQLTGAIYYLPLLLAVPAFAPGGPLGGFLVESDVPGWAVAASVLYAIPAALMVASQGPGHGSYMDAGTVWRRDNEWSKRLLDLIPPLRERPLITSGAEAVYSPDGRRAYFPNAARDFVGGLLKGVVLIALPPTLIWWAWTGHAWAFVFVAAGAVYPLAWFVNNRWWRHLGRIGIAPGTPVYWAELFQGAAFGAGAWGVALTV